MSKRKLGWIIDPLQEAENPLLTWLWCGFLFLCGLILWGVLLNFGEIPFDFHDWAEVNAPRIAFLQDAIRKGVLPLHMADASALRGVTDRYMALPDVILSPQVLLLKWLDVGDFILVHTWLLFALGFWGLYRLKKMAGLSLLTFSWLFLLFNFNGHLVSHYAVGHVTWGGTFLFSWFIYLVMKLLNGDHSWRWVAQISFLLFFIFLQGSFHQFVWCLLFLGVLALTGVRNFFSVLKAGAAACLLSLVRIVPPALQMGSFDDEFLGGFSSLRQLFDAFVRIIPPADSLNPEATGSFLGWWEFDAYLGYAGAAALIVFGIVWLAARDKKSGFPAVLLPVAVIALFSVSKFYEWFRLIPIPLFTGERVSSRMLILPLVFGFFFAAAGMQNALNSRRKPLFSAVIAILTLITADELWQHLSVWQVTNAFQSFPYTYTDLSIKTVNNHADPQYTSGLLIGLSVTVLTALVLLLLVWREARQKNAGTDLTPQNE